jgi:hypothetical protein
MGLNREIGIKVGVLNKFENNYMYFSMVPFLVQLLIHCYCSFFVLHATMIEEDAHHHVGARSLSWTNFVASAVSRRIMVPA